MGTYSWKLISAARYKVSRNILGFENGNWANQVLHLRTTPARDYIMSG